MGVCKLTPTSLMKNLDVLVVDHIETVDPNEYPTQMAATYLKEVRLMQLWYNDSLSTVVDMLKGNVTDIDGMFTTYTPSQHPTFLTAVDSPCVV